MRRKSFAFAILLAGFLIVSSFAMIRLMQDPPGVSWISATNNIVC